MLVATCTCMCSYTYVCSYVLCAVRCTWQLVIGWQAPTNEQFSVHQAHVGTCIAYERDCRQLMAKERTVGS